MKGKLRLPAAIGMSVMVHLAAFWLWPVDQEDAQDALVLEMEILPPVQPQPVFKPLEQPALDPIQIAPPPRIPPQIAVAPPVEPETEKEAPSFRVLNLNRPAIWDELVNSDLQPSTRGALPFNPGLEERVLARFQERRRELLLASRYRSVDGLSDEEFGRTGPMGDEVKVNGRCFSLQDTPEMGAEPRWWMTQCRDPVQKPLEMKPLAFDASGRAIAD